MHEESSRSRDRRLSRRKRCIHKLRDSSGESLRLELDGATVLELITSSGQISIQGPLGEVRASTSSGRVDVQDVESLRARSRSGNIDVRDCRGSVKLGIVSGKIAVERAGSVELVGVSGNVELRQIAGKVGALLVSGSVQAQSNGGGVVEIASISGDLRVELPGHLRPAVKTHQMTGKLRNDLPAGDDLKVDLSSVSGDIAIGAA